MTQPATVNKRIRTCPICDRKMNRCTEENDLFYCPHCLVHVRNGQIVTTNKDGNYSESLGQVNDRPRLTVVPESQQKQNIDIYFNSGNKKAFRGVLAHWPQGRWIILKKAVKGKAVGEGNIDFYFSSGDKKQFPNVEARTFFGAWIILQKSTGQEISVNSHNVNWFETDTEIHINGNNVNYLEEM